MTIRVALHHVTEYTYDRLVNLGPQVVRLRPAPHCRTPIRSYSLKVEPEEHFVNLQQDPHGNFLARFVFSKPTRKLRVEVDMVAEMTVINPFDFFLEPSAEQFPFAYEELLARELRPYLETLELGPSGKRFLAGVDQTPQLTADFLVALNRRVQQEIAYMIRLEPGVQTPEETLTQRSGSCRDSAWLMVQVLRQLGLAARFVSGYLIQLTADIENLDGPAGPTQDFTDLHAWAEVYLPGAGWIGLDPTSGLLVSEGHIPLACTPDPQTAAPISGALDACECEFAFQMKITRIHEDPRVTKPFTEVQWQAINAIGGQIDERLTRGDVRLTMGGEPTFVSIDDMEGAEWNSAAVGPHKRRLSEILLKRLRDRFAPGGMLHYGQGKWYPGEPLPRWSLTCYWRRDGVPLWENADLIAEVDVDYGYGVNESRKFVRYLAKLLGVSCKWVTPAYEDVAHYLWREQRLPINVDASDPKLKDPEERASIARVFERGINQPVGFVMPLQRQWWQAKPRWTSGPWPVRSDQLFLLPGDSPIGLRLPIESLPVQGANPLNEFHPVDPLAPRGPLPLPAYRNQSFVTPPQATEPPKPWRVHQQFSTATGVTSGSPSVGTAPMTSGLKPQPDEDDDDLDELSAEHRVVVRTALCIEPRDGRLHVFMPPLEILEDYLELVSAIERTASDLNLPIVLEGYLPPNDPRIDQVKVTPDPGVIEVNIHPAANWSELVQNTTILYEEARLSRLGTEKFDLDGKHTGTGGGNHVVLGGATPADSPILRRPDLLKSLIGFWINHPSLSYLFSGRFIGPTSQAPRVDEGRRDALYELELAFSVVPKPGEKCPPWLVDRIFRNLLVDLTGNTHRAEFCIDKLYSPDSSSGRLGLLEFRGFEMPPHAQMSLTQQLLIRALVARFWDTPYEQPIINWETSLHDRFALPYFIWQDFGDVLDELRRSGIDLDRNWFASHLEFRYPMIGELAVQDMHVELRTAMEPWYVLGEEPAGGGTVRFVDSSVERLQVKVSGIISNRYVMTCQGRRLPLHPTGVPGEAVCGVRYRAWCPPSALHPTIPVHAPLVFDLHDAWAGRSVGGCSYHVSHPAGRSYQTFPVNAYEAEARRSSRFFRNGHTPGGMPFPPEELNPVFPMTLDLRRGSMRQ